MTRGSGSDGGAAPSLPSHRRPHRIFDREKPPHDWRWIVSGIGKALIVTGLLMFAFVAYQLWGTGIYTAQAQNRLDRDFDKLSIAARTTVATTTTSTQPPLDLPSTVLDTTAPSVSTAPPSSAAPTTSGAPPTTLPAGAVPFPFVLPASGNVLARLQIPTIDVDYKVVEGVGLDDLAQGPGHFPESALPGQLGNAAVAGHRTTHGAPFYDVDHLRPGDQIIFTYPKVGDASGPRFVYLVTGTEVVAPSAYAAVVPTTDASKATLILASCTPIRSASKRIIIRAELDLSQSSPIFAPTPRSAASPNGTIPGDDGASSTVAGTTAGTTPSTAAGPAVAGTTVAGTTVSGTTAVDDTAAGTTVATGSDVTTAPADTTVVAGAPVVTTPPSTDAGTPPATNPPAASQDAFAGGWFDDSAAWPDIGLWGLALALIAYGGYRLARSQRRIWLGTLAAFVPFVLVLYFWFENINRLLPPGL